LTPASATRRETAVITSVVVFVTAQAGGNQAGDVVCHAVDVVDVGFGQCGGLELCGCVCVAFAGLATTEYRKHVGVDVQTTVLTTEVVTFYVLNAW
jgi:hypothetical protein